MNKLLMIHIKFSENHFCRSWVTMIYVMKQIANTIEKTIHVMDSVVTI